MLLIYMDALSCSLLLNCSDELLDIVAYTFRNHNNLAIYTLILLSDSFSTCPL